MFGLKAVPSRQMQCRMTASLRAVATAAFLKPLRSCSRLAQVRRYVHSGGPAGDVICGRRTSPKGDAEVFGWYDDGQRRSFPAERRNRLTEEAREENL